MNRMDTKLFCVAALFVVNAYGQTKYCCHPGQWESINYINEAQIASGTKKPVYTQGNEALSVDGPNHRIASLSTLNSGGFKVNVQVIQLYDKRVMYTVQSGECKQTPLPPWSPRCIPDTATLVKQTFYGVGDNKIDIDIYQVISGPNTIYLNIAHADCTPMYQSGYGSAQGVSALGFKTYTNITTGIKDTSVFDVPSICTNATVNPQILVPKYGFY